MFVPPNSHSLLYHRLNRPNKLEIKVVMKVSGRVCDTFGILLTWNPVYVCVRACTRAWNPVSVCVRKKREAGILGGRE